MTAALSALHVADMANIKQMLLIPQSTLRLPVSCTSVHVCLWITLLYWCHVFVQDAVFMCDSPVLVVALNE